MNFKIIELLKDYVEKNEQVEYNFELIKIKSFLIITIGMISSFLNFQNDLSDILSLFIEEYKIFSNQQTLSYSAILNSAYLVTIDNINNITPFLSDFNDQVNSFVYKLLFNLFISLLLGGFYLNHFLKYSFYTETENDKSDSSLFCILTISLFIYIIFSSLLFLIDPTGGSNSYFQNLKQVYIFSNEYFLLSLCVFSFIAQFIYIIVKSEDKTKFKVAAKRHFIEFEESKALFFNLLDTEIKNKEILNDIYDFSTKNKEHKDKFFFNELFKILNDKAIQKEKEQLINAQNKKNIDFLNEDI